MTGAPRIGRRRACLLACGLPLALAGCDPDAVEHAAIQGLWELKDPVHPLLSGTLQFWQFRFQVVEHRQVDAGIARREMLGQYELLGGTKIRMAFQRGLPAIEPEERIGSVRLAGDVLNLDLNPGSFVYQRI